MPAYPPAHRDRVLRFVVRFVVAALSVACWAVYGPAALAADAATISDPACATAPGDRFENASRFSPASVRFAGLCVDTGRYRPAANLAVAPDSVRFDNYVLDQKFWSAELRGDFAGDDSPIESVKFVIMRFAVVEGVEAAHSQLRFRLRPDRKAKLSSQTGSETAEGDDIMVTFEAGLPQGQTYNFALGAFPAYALVGRVGSTKQKMLERRGSVAIEQYDLKLEPREGSRLLRDSLRRSQELGMGTFYNTLRPNCTTEVFQLIDGLPRIADLLREKGIRPFLTVLSTDPIATPSLRALSERGILGARNADFEDEIEGRLNAKPMPDLVDKLPAFLPTPEGHVWTVAVAHSPESRLTPAEKAALEKVRSEIVAASVRLAQSSASAFLLAREGAYADVLAATLARLPSEIAAEIRRQDHELPDEAFKLAVYLVPLLSEVRTVNLSQFGVPAALPIATKTFEWNLDSPAGQQAVGEMVSGSRRAAITAAQSGAAAYLLGTAIVIDAARGRSQLTTQIRLGFAPAQRPFASENEQVKISALRLGEPDAPMGDRPTALLTHRQAAAAVEPNPIVHVEFGPDGGIAARNDREGQLQVFLSATCEGQAAGAPHLLGVFGPRPTGHATTDHFLEGRPVAFRVLGFDLELRDMRARNMNIAVKSWPFSCREDDEVERSFEEKANEAIEAWKQRAQSAGFVENLLGRLL